MAAVKMMIVALIVLSTAMSGATKPVAAAGDYVTDLYGEEDPSSNTGAYNSPWLFVEEYAPIARANAEFEKSAALEYNEVGDEVSYSEEELPEELPEELSEEGFFAAEAMSPAESSAFGFPMRRAAWRRGVRAYDPHHWITLTRRAPNPGPGDGQDSTVDDFSQEYDT